MGHMIEGLVVGTTATAKATSAQGAVPIPLNVTGLAFIPMTDALLDRLAEIFPATAGQPHPEFWKLSTSAIRWIEDLSTAGHVAYVETEYFAGVGAQAAAVWENGRLILSPRKADIGPINDALRLLGVRRTPTEDEFSVAGLDRCRATADWLPI